MSPSDQTLLQQYASRQDADAFAQIVRRHAGLVYSACLRVAGNPYDAEDAAQECFLDLARHAGSITTSLPGWLYTAATNQARMGRRKNATRDRHEDRARREGRTDAEPAWREIAPFVDDALDRLPEEYRLPLVLHFLQGKSQELAAGEIGVSQATVSRRIEKGISLLRGQLRKSGVIVSTSLLVVLLVQNSATAAPVTLCAGLGKLALSGIGAADGGTPAAATKATGGIAMKVTVSALLVAALVTGATLVHHALAEKPAAATIAPVAPTAAPAEPTAASMILDYAAMLALYPPADRAQLRVPTPDEIAQLGALWPNVPPQENGVYYCVLAATQLAPAQEAPAGSAFAPDKPYAGDVQVIERWVERNQIALETLRKGLAAAVYQPPCFIVAGSGPQSGTPSPNSLPGVRELAQAALDAGFLEQLKDNPPGATERYAECVRLGESLQAGTQSNTLLAVAIVGLGQKALDALAADVELPEPILRQIIEKCGAAEVAQDDPSRTWGVELTYYHATMALRKDLPQGSPIELGLARFFGGVKDTIASKPLDALLQTTTRNSLLNDALRDAPPGIDSLGASYGVGYAKMGRLNLRLRATQLRAAICLYRQTHAGKLPETLDALVPDILPSVPTDPFTGKPLRYERTEFGGWKLWSAGEDNVDDGGRINLDIYGASLPGWRQGMASEVVFDEWPRGCDYIFVMYPPPSLQVKFSEGIAGAGAIRTAMRIYSASHGGEYPAFNNAKGDALGKIGITAKDFVGKYFGPADYSVTTTPGGYTITVRRGTDTYTLNEGGVEGGTLMTRQPAL